MTTRTRFRLPVIAAAVCSMGLTLSPAVAQFAVVNESFETWNNTGSNNPAAYPYPEVTDWTYVGVPLRTGLPGAISETLTTIPDTPHGNNWLLLDERMFGQYLYQSLTTISAGDPLTLSALIARPTNTTLSDFEVALYRSIGGSGTPDQLLTSIGLPDVLTLGAGASTEVSKTYTTTAADAGETLFVRLGMVNGDNVGAALQALVDRVSVSVAVDAIPPTIVPPTSPVNGATNVLVFANLTATFTENVALGDGGTVTLRDLGPGPDVVITLPDARVSASGNIMTINPASDLTTSNDYAVQISGNAVKDQAGNFFVGIANDVTWNFTTFSSATGPFPLPLVNPEFEVDPLAEGISQPSITGWSNAGSCGVLNPNGTATPVSGNNVAFTNPSSQLLYQDTGHLLLPNSRYKLTVYVGRQTTAANLPSWRVQLLTSTNGLASSTDYAQLRADGTTNTLDAGSSASGVTQGESVAGELYPVSLTWTTGTAPTGLGQRLFVRFFVDNASAQALWDNVSLTVQPVETYADWIAKFPGVGGQTGLDADPDGDGSDNGVENYFGTDPGAFSPGLVAGAVSSNTFTFSHPLNESPASDLIATYRWSTDLLAFQADGTANGAGTTTVAFSQAPPSAGQVTVTATVTGSVIPHRLFVDVKVTQQ